MTKQKHIEDLEAVHEIVVSFNDFLDYQENHGKCTYCVCTVVAAMVIAMRSQENQKLDFNKVAEEMQFLADMLDPIQNFIVRPLYKQQAKKEAENWLKKVLDKHNKS